MNKLFVVAFIWALSGISAPAMPLASVQIPDGIIKVKDGCPRGYYMWHGHKFGSYCQKSTKFRWPN
jgi:hypothetical protein